MKTTDEWMVEHMKLIGMSEDEIKEQIATDIDKHCTLIKAFFGRIQQDAIAAARADAVRLIKIESNHADCSCSRDFLANVATVLELANLKE